MHDFLQVDDLLTDEDRAIRDTVRDFAQSELAPHVAEWYDEGTLPDDLGRVFGKIGLLGMHLEGYGCAGTSATAYGVACRELEAVDSGLRQFVSVQGSLAMYAIHRWGTDEQKDEWLPRMADRRGDRVLRADRARRRQRPRLDEDARAARRRRLGPQRLQDVDHQRHPRRRRDRVGADRRAGSAASWSRRTRRASPPTKIQRKLSLRASVTAELAFDDLRLPGRRGVPRGARAQGSAVVPQRGALRHRLGRRSARPAPAWRSRWPTRWSASSSASRWRRSSSPSASSRR